MTRHTAAARVWTGSAILGRRIGRRLTTWIAAGRRDDLTGWRAALGPIVRAGLLLAAGYLAVRIIRAVPAVLWLLAPAWLVAAYRLGFAPAPAPEAEPAAQPVLDPVAALALWLLDVIGDRPGVHLAELYPAMRRLTGHHDRPDAVLRAALRARGIPIVRSLRIGPVAGRSGVRRADVEALLPHTTATAVERSGDAAQSPDSPRLSAPGEEVKSA